MAKLCRECNCSMRIVKIKKGTAYRKGIKHWECGCGYMESYDNNPILHDEIEREIKEKLEKDKLQKPTLDDQ